MDTDLLDLGCDGAAASSDDPYSKATEVVRRPVLTSGSTMTPGSKPGVSVDKAEPIASLPSQNVFTPSSTSATLWPEPPPLHSAPSSMLLPDPPAMHPPSVHSEHYKSPGPVNDGASATGISKPGPELLPKSMVGPAIPPRKPRIPTPNAAPGRSETAASKSTQPQPPLPHFRKSSTDSFDNRMYGVSTAENPQPRPVEVNGNPPPVPVPRNTASVNSVQVPASSNQAATSLDSTIPCENLSSDEQVRA